MRTPAIGILILGACAALPGAEPPQPPAPTQITWEKPDAPLGEVAGHLSEKAGIPVSVDPALAKTRCDLPPLRDVPFWQALDSAVGKAGARVALSNGGRKVGLVPRGPSREVSATSGAFRVVAQQVVGRALLDQGTVNHEVHLLVHWEPRVRVYRIDSVPRVARVAVDTGSKVAAEGGGTQILPLDATSELKVRLTGVPRAGDRITTLAGEFGVTAAERLLAFTLQAPGGAPTKPQMQAGVTVALNRVQKKGDTWEVELEAAYPPGQPAFESFQGEWWLRDNRLTVRSPEGKPFVIEDYEVPMPDNPRPLRAIYRFKEDPKAGLGDPTAKGWSLVYETPSPLADVKVPFELKDIPLP